MCWAATKTRRRGIFESNDIVAAAGCFMIALHDATSLRVIDVVPFQVSGCPKAREISCEILS